MRWVLACLSVVVLAWGAYVASPYWALRDLALAVERGDAAALAARVNFRALRHSIARHLASDFAASDRSGTVMTSDAQLAAGAVAAAADPLMEQLMTAEGIVRLLRPPSGASAAEAGAFRPGAASLDRLAALLSGSSWRGFRNVYFTLPPEASREERFRLQMRFSRLSWRLVGLELPQAARRRYAQEILRRLRPGQ